MRSAFLFLPLFPEDTAAAVRKQTGAPPLAPWEQEKRSPAVIPADCPK